MVDVCIGRYPCFDSAYHNEYLAFYQVNNFLIRIISSRDYILQINYTSLTHIQFNKNLVGIQSVEDNVGVSEIYCFSDLEREILGLV